MFTLSEGTHITEFNARKVNARVDVHRRYENQLLFPRLFGSRQCEKLIEAGIALPRDKGLVSSGVTDNEDLQARKAGIAWMEPEGEFGWVFEKLAKAVVRANRIYRFALSGFTEDAQFTCYDQRGSFYDWHQDGLEGELSGRKLSIVVQLSDPDDYRGGDLELFSVESDPEFAKDWKKDLRARGTAIVFPAFEYHRVTPIRRGKRYSLVCWVGGPPFR